MSTGSFEYFSEDYSAARRRFLAAGHALGADLSQLRLGLTAPDNSPLSIDVAWLGTTSPARVLIHSSGLHGVEGFAGSAIQLALMDQSSWIPSDGAVLFVHTLNPFGMAWFRRFNENNVDLNRNFHAPGEERPITSDAYRRLETFLNPRSPPSIDFFYARAAYYVLRYGLGRLKQALAEGQYEFPNGLFFGGTQLEKGPALYQSWLASQLKSIERGFAIDVHTGLGKLGQESLFLRRAPPANDSRLAERLGRHLASDATEEGVGYGVHGGYAHCFDALPRRVRMHVVTQEFGTYPSLQVLHALREENRWQHYGDGAITHPAKLRLKEVFAPVESAWRGTVIEHGVSLGKAVMGYLFQ
ncbi:MAG: DUF2817 domain-containing protein [Deltaproteobacteria bacterium]|nr:DUF2817 domain-containing protein [Deltaproteobacteria bacterium]